MWWSYQRIQKINLKGIIMESNIGRKAAIFFRKKPYSSILLGASLLCSATPALAGWEVQWIDKFNGSGVNWDNWTAQTEANYNNEVQCYTADDSSSEKNYDVSDGTLKIIARKKGNNCSTLNNQYKTWTSGRLNSKDKQEFLYGRIESRIRFHNLEGGTWPAFWMLENRIAEQPIKGDGDYINWPNAGAGEIDVWEWFSNSPNTYITNFFNTESCASQVNYTYPNGSVDVLEWHNYALEWQENEISFYIDEVLVTTQDVTDCSQYNEPMFVLLNVAMGGNLGGNIDANLEMATMEVDYVAHCTPSDANSATYCNEALVDDDDDEDKEELKVTINVLQNGLSVTYIDPADGPVTLSAEASNLQSDKEYSYDWNTDQLASPVTINDKVIFDPASMDDGNYDVSVKLTDQQDSEFTDSDTLTLQVKATTAPVITPTPTESSNGGSTGQLFLITLSLLCLFRRRFK